MLSSIVIEGLDEKSGGFVSLDKLLSDASSSHATSGIALPSLG